MAASTTLNITLRGAPKVARTSGWRCRWDDGAVGI